MSPLPLVLAAALGAPPATAQSVPPAAAVEAPASGQMINLSCMEALAVIGQDKLAGVFSFISEKDSAPAFADFVVRDKKTLKRFLDKVESDFKQANGVAEWDKRALQFALSIYSSPIAETIEKPGEKVIARLSVLAQAPALSITELSSRRRRP